MGGTYFRRNKGVPPPSRGYNLKNFSSFMKFPPPLTSELRQLMFFFRVSMRYMVVSIY